MGTLQSLVTVHVFDETGQGRGEGDGAATHPATAATAATTTHADGKLRHLAIEVRHSGETIFPRGSLRCTVPAALSDKEVRSTVLSLIALQPGAVEREYLQQYTPTQRAWVARYGEDVDVERQARYGV